MRAALLAPLALALLLAPLAARGEEAGAAGLTDPGAVMDAIPADHQGPVVKDAVVQDAQAILETPAAKADYKEEIEKESRGELPGEGILETPKLPAEPGTALRLAVTNSVPSTNVVKVARTSVPLEMAMWKRLLLDLPTQTVWQAECESFVPGLADAVQAGVTVTFGTGDFLRLDYAGDNTYRVTCSNGLVRVSFPGSEVSDLRPLREGEWPWDDLLGIPLQGSLSNYYTRAYQEGALWRYDFFMEPEAQQRLRPRSRELPFVAIRRHVWVDKSKMRVVKTYRRTVGGEEYTFVFAGSDFTGPAESREEKE